MEDKGWRKWPVLEGLAKALSKACQKIIGTSGATVGSTFTATAIVGLVQTMAGLIGARVRGVSLVPSWPQVGASITFGMIVMVITVGVFLVFVYDGDAGVATFLETSSIVLGALVDKFYFGRNVTRSKWAGVAIFILGGWCILDFPNLSEFVSMPPWVWISIGVAFLLVFGEALNQWLALDKQKVVDEFAHNFWVGLTTLMFSAFGVLVIGLFMGWEAVFAFPERFYIASTITGGIVVAMISFKLLAYKAGGTITVKKQIKQITYLALALAFGVFFLGEPMTIGKWLGLGLFALSLWVMDLDEAKEAAS